jgi:DNA-binding response OmpR family regulator
MSQPARQILVAEASPTKAQRVRHALEQHGYQVTTAASGAAVLEAARQPCPALVLSDTLLPDMTGYELCRRIRKEPELAEVPVLLVTTSAAPDEVIRVLECGADHFIPKPYEPEQLLRRIESLLANSRSLPDKSLLKATQEALRQTNLELQQLRQRQQTVIQQERLRALGQMASGMAHDINNAISPISLYTDILLDHEPGLSPSAREQIETIRRAIEDVAGTVARMREFYRPQEPRIQLYDIELNPLVRQVVDLTRARWSDQPQRAGILIELRTQLATDLPVVRGAENDIRDALTNLIFNAVDALSGGGVIEVRTGTTTQPGPEGTPMHWVQLEVCDTGIGMDEETRKRCLEPFFTKKAERGSGLGLAMVYGMAQRHRAVLEIDSTPGLGTTMRLLFPAGTDGAAAANGFTPSTEPQRSLRILVIDDDTLLSQSLSNALRTDGHEVTVADGGEAGIAAFQPGCFDVVITDLGMPCVDGRQVARAIRSASPTTPIVMLTGWGRALQAQGAPPEVNRVLNKPPRLCEIRAVLAELTARQV